MASKPTKKPPVKKAVPKPKVITKTVTKTVYKYKHELTQVQLDQLGLQVAGLPIANKDKEIVAHMLVDHLGVSDTDRFYKNIHETELPTPKT